MQPHQLALVDQSIRHALTRYDDQHGLLRSSEDPRFRVVQESLLFAALLLTRSASGEGRTSELGLARLLIDRLLPLQNSTRRDPDRGLFPILWTPDKARTQIMDPDSREIMGSLLGLLLKDYGALLGDKRAARVREAVRLAIREKDQSVPETTSGAMIAAWLELEFGDQWRGERLATEVAMAGYGQLIERRFGDARAFAREMWALSLWRRSNRLHDSVAGLVGSVLDDIHSCVHPALPEIFGAVTTSSTSSDTSYPWLGTWLTWHALGGEPMLPRNMSDPLHSTLYAFPALAKLKFEEAGESPIPPVSESRSFSRSLERVHDRHSLTGWWEQDLHIEARSSTPAEAQRLPVAGARWRARNGATVWLRCRVNGHESAVCRKRFVHLENPGSAVISVHNMAPGDTRMIDNGWWLSGLHFATEGFQMVDAERSERGLTMRLKPTGDQAILMFSPLN